ncbi:MAG: DUF4012 domain-containing protein [Actinomycetota bacterium]|nr:DUF4012 domain-containing protein [Actinomycetota bacterium]
MRSEKSRKGLRSPAAFASALAVVALLIGIGVALAISWRGTYQQALTTKSTLTQLRNVVQARDWVKVDPLLVQARQESQALDASTHSLSWRLLSMIPVVGSSAGAVGDLATSVEEILIAAQPLVPYAQQVVHWQLQGNDGSFDLSSLAKAAPEIRELGRVLAVSGARLQEVNLSHAPQSLVTAVNEVRDLAVNSADAVTAAADLATWGPSLVGADGARTWLVMLQNPAEARGSGGFPGGYLTVTAKDGRLNVRSVGTSNDLSKHAIPDGSAPADSKSLWGKRLKAWNSFNQSPHFPMVAKLAAAGMAARGEPVGGVVAVDPRMVAALLKVIGPIAASGQTVTAENAEKFFMVDVYAKYRDERVRDDVTMAVVQAILAKFLSVPLDPSALVNALREPIAQGHMRAWSDRPKEESWLAQTAVGGVVLDTAGPVIAVVSNNSAGSKMDAFVSTAIDYRVGSCSDATRQSTIAITLTNNAPKGLPRGLGTYDRYDDYSAPANSTSTVLAVYPPVNSNFNSATIDGKNAPMYLGHERNRQVWYIYLPINQGQKRVLDVSFGQPRVLGVAARVITQSMAIDPEISIADEAACS